jgi:phage replication O-like protein O
MASPQLENGYTRFANELMAALAMTRIPGEARQILDTVLRKTYGWQKKEDQISISQFHEATGIKKPSIIRAMKILLSMKLIIVSKKANSKGHVYEFNKNYESWQPLAKKLTFTKKLTSVSNNAKNRLPKSYPQKKKENTKEIHVLLFDEFWENYPPRNGKKLEKQKTFEAYCRLSDSDVSACNQAVKNYANSEGIRQRIGIRDPKRFLKDEFWKDWIGPEKLFLPKLEGDDRP